MGLKLLNNKQIEEFKQVFGFYKYFYICPCGNLYGSDYEEKEPECLDCEKIRRENK